MKKKVLPERYPRESEIVIFEELIELDHVNELLDGMGKDLATLDVPGGKWDDDAQKLRAFFAADPLTTLIRKLRRAFVECMKGLGNRRAGRWTMILN